MKTQRGRHGIGLGLLAVALVGFVTIGGAWGAPAQVTVTYPNGGEKLVRGQTYTVTWTGTGPFWVFVWNTDTNMFTQIGDTSAYSCSWTVPADFALGSAYRIEVDDLGVLGVPYDLSDGFWSVVDHALDVTSPNGGESWAVGSTQNITWTSGGVTGDVNLYLYDTGVGGDWAKLQKLATVPVGDGTWSWDTTGLDSHGDYRIRVQSVSIPTLNDYSDADFTLTGGAATLQLTAPNGGETWDPGSTETIEWDSTNLSGYVRLYLYDNYTKIRALADIPVSDGEWDWAIPGAETVASTYRIRVQSLAMPALNDYGDRMFGIGTDLEVTSPNGGENWVVNPAGSSQDITWTATGFGGNVQIFLYDDDILGAPAGNPAYKLKTLATVAAGAGTWSWDTSAETAGNYVVRIKSLESPAFQDLSDAAFTLIPVP